MITLKSLHNHLRLLENSSELKRRLPGSSLPRTLREGLQETSKLAGVDETVFKDPQIIAALIGAQRFVMIWGEPSVTDQVARVFDNSRVLLTALAGLASNVSAESTPAVPVGVGAQSGDAMAALVPGRTQPRRQASDALAEPTPEREAPLDSLRPLLSGNASLTCRLFRAVFEHMLGFALQSSG